MNEFYPWHRIMETISDYLCTECKHLLYLGLNTKEEICVNPNCILFPFGTEFYNINGAQKLKKEIDELKNSLLAKIKEFNETILKTLIFSYRKKLIDEFFAGKGIILNEFFTTNQMLIDLNSISPSIGCSKTNPDFESLLQEYSYYVTRLNFIEDLENGRRLIRVSDNEIFQIKYLDALFLMLRNWGLISSSNGITEDVFRYSEIDQQVREDIQLEQGMELGKYFVQFFEHIIRTKYALCLYYRTAQQVKYDVSSADIAALLGLFFSNRSKWTVNGIKSHLLNYKKYGLDIDAFLREYMVSKAKTPILVLIEGDQILCDPNTILFFLFHLLGLNDENVKEPSLSIAQKKQQAAEVFEQRVRELLSENGYSVPDKPVKISRASPEYDAIAINETEKIIILAEAKYWDVSSSSISGRTLIEQELLQEKRLLDQMLKQRKRIDFFNNNFLTFKEELTISGERETYRIFACVVTKFIPLVRKYKNVHSVDYFNLTNWLRKII